MNAETIKKASEEQLDHMFCTLIEAVASRLDQDDMCAICPVSAKCTRGRSGFISWLNESNELNFREFIIGL